MVPWYHSILLLAGSDREFSTKIITGWKFVSVFELIVASVMAMFCIAVAVTVQWQSVFCAAPLPL